MAIHTLQTILCRAALDRAFLAQLSGTPRGVLQQYDLTADEVEVLAEAPDRTLVGLAGAVEGWRRGEVALPVVRHLAMAG